MGSTPKTAPARTSDLQRAIRSLNQRIKKGDKAPHRDQTDLEAMERKREKDYELYDRAKQIWLAMSPAERDNIRKRVLKKDPYYRERPHSYSFELSCIDYIGSHIS